MTSRNTLASGAAPYWETDIAIIPIYFEEDLLRPGKVKWGLGWEDFQKVRQGYGCPECLEDFNGVYMAVCPVCAHVRDVSRDILPTPEHFNRGEYADAPEGGI